MAIVFKKTLRRNPIEANVPGKYYPQIVNVGKKMNEEDIIYEMKEKSSLSKGDIESVISNFTEAVRAALFNGHSVNIRNFGCFALSARADGSNTEKECTASTIKSVNINFRPSPYIRPNLTATRGGEKLTFVDLNSYLKTLSLNGLTSDPEGSQKDKDDENVVDPNA